MRVSLTTAIQTIMQEVNTGTQQRKEAIAKARAYRPVLVQPEKDPGPMRLPLKTSGMTGRMVNYAV